MMPAVKKGDRMEGLLVYLAGPGRYNEHLNPHIVAGDPTLMAWRKESTLDRAGAFALARHLERPRRAFGQEAIREGSVWHCSLSLKPDEGALTDAKWAAIARDFADGMGLTSTRTPCRWVAVWHGPSKGGNDHIHFVATRVADNGNIFDVRKDFPRSQAVVSQLERTHGLVVLESRLNRTGDRWHTPAEQARADRTGASEPDRTRLARTVRACAAASADEAEFVRRARRAGLTIRPRYATGRTDVVTGYSVAVRPPRGEKPIWFGGGRLAKDLTLTRLRADWPDTPEDASAAVDEWQAAFRGRRVVAPGRELTDPGPEQAERFAAELAELRERLRAVPPDDRATWAYVAREAAGAFAAWSVATEAIPGPLAATASALARSAQVRAHVARTRRDDLPSARGTGRMLTAHPGGPSTGSILRELANLAKALHDAHLAIGEAQRAAEIANAVRSQLAAVSAALPAATARDPALPAPRERPSDETIER